MWDNILPPEQTFIQDGDTVTVQCEKGHVNTGDSEITCNVEGDQDMYLGAAPHCLLVPGNV